jgi:hypothetical protein
MVPTNEPTTPVHRGFTRALVAVDPLRPVKASDSAKVVAR